MSSTMSNSQNLRDYVVKEGNGVTGLVHTGIKSLPDEYIQPPEKRFDKSKVLHDESTPIIDVSNWDDQKVKDSIVAAASKWGFFQITNHGIPQEVLESIKDAAHRFFELPVEEKKKYNCTGTVQFSTSFTPHAEKVLEWKDYLSFLYYPEASASWPHACRNEVLEYMKAVEPVYKKLLEVLLHGLKVNESDKAKEYLLMGAIRINVNYYPICPNPDLAAGIGPHCDISTITVLLQDDTGGLYVRASEGDAWISVPPVEGALVVNIGDVLQILSNDRYKSIEHCVAANRSKSRVSIPLFVNPGRDAVIGPLLEVLEGGETPIYEQVCYLDYFKYFFSKAHEGKTTLKIAQTG